MRSFFEEIKDSSLTWATDDDISIPSESESDSSSDGDSSLEPNEPDIARVPVDIDQIEEQDVVLIGHQNVEELDHVPNGIPVGVVIPRNIDNNIDQHEHVNDQPQPPREIAHNPNGNILNRRNSMEILRNIESHARSSSLLFRIARSEVLPLIRAEIDWALLQTELATYPSSHLGDEYGVFLLQNILRMDPPCELIKELLKLYPKSCVDMDPFYAACQYSSDDAVQLLIKRTMKARKNEGIYWSMLALLGDARIRLRHAKMLLQFTPAAVVDPSHGPFGVSPLDRMMSGAFIHGDKEEWVSKLKLALLTAERGGTDDCTGKSFFPFHVLLKRIASCNFMGVEFGALTFINCLSACIDGESNHSPFHQVDDDGHYPLQSLLREECNTNLGIMGERKLIKFLLFANEDSVMKRDKDRKLPIRLAIENGWPVYDIISNHCPSEYILGINSDNSSNSAYCNTGDSKSGSQSDLLIHDMLSGPFNHRFGVSGARAMVKYVLDKFPSSATSPDSQGRYPIHLAVQNGWPCHDLIVSTAPLTLEIRDAVNNMYPFQIAACTSHVKIKVEQSDRELNQIQLSTLYELVRESPLLLLHHSLDERFINVARRNRDSYLHLLKDEPPLKRKR